MGEGNRPGGSVALAAELDDHGEVLIADFRQYYGLSLGAIYDGSLSVAEALVLIEQLPMESRYVAAKRGGAEFVGWDEGRYIQALQVNLMKNLIWLITRVNSKKAPPAPKLYPLPGESKKNEAGPDGNTFKGMLEAAKAAAEKKAG